MKRKNVSSESTNTFGSDDHRNSEKRKKLVKSSQENYKCKS